MSSARACYTRIYVEERGRREVFHGLFFEMMGVLETRGEMLMWERNRGILCSWRSEWNGTCERYEGVVGVGGCDWLCFFLGSLGFLKEVGCFLRFLVFM